MHSMSEQEDCWQYLIYGSGAVGSTIGARLWLSGKRVTLVARGDHARVLKEQGLHFLTPELDQIIGIPSVDRIAEVDFKNKTIVLLCVKSQQTKLAIEELAMVAPADIPICCVQNGVSNERTVLRYFKNVYATLVNLPAMYLKAGEVASYVSGLSGVLDTGRYPTGTDRLSQEIAKDLRDAGFGAVADPRVMRKKYGKLLMNVGNAVQAIIDPEDDVKEVYRSVRKETEAVYFAGNIDYADRKEMSDLTEEMKITPVPGYERTASSSWQSLMRNTGDIETDYLNGEIALLGRMHGIPTPYNDHLARIAREFVLNNRPPGGMKLSEFLKGIDR